MKRFTALLALLLCPTFASADFQAGAVVVDASPRQFPVFVNGGMRSRSAKSALKRHDIEVVNGGAKRKNAGSINSFFIPLI